MEIPAILNRGGDRRKACDLLWFPTGGGKTEAYLAVAAFVMAWRRLDARARGLSEGYGVAVLSRYTLRLLTIQQFRRALSLVTACEKLRCQDWRPTGWIDAEPAPVWGGERFGIGLWVGSSVTPGNLTGSRDYPGAIEILKGILPKDSADPAQVLNCPCCGSVLAVTQEHLRKDAHLPLHLVCLWTGSASLPDLKGPTPDGNFEISDSRLSGSGNFRTLSLDITVLQKVEGGTLEPIQTLWNHVKTRLEAGGISAYLQAGDGQRADRPGYFFRKAQWGGMKSTQPIDFEIVCPAPDCGLEVDWSETRQEMDTLVPEAFRTASGGSRRIPIPASTVDAQIYGRCPSMVVATVDKFAMLPFRPEAATMFGNTDRFAPHIGYWRSGMEDLKSKPAKPQWKDTAGFLPPDLVLQDELHLIEGPLGSMVGIYETALDALMGRWDATGSRTFRSHYVASSATVRAAGEQVRALYDRSLNIFPPPGLDASDSFFSRTPTNLHPLDPEAKGRIYLGVCAPGSSPLIPPRNLWARLLQHGQDRLEAGADRADLDGFWSIVSYYNAIRELAGSSRMVEQDVQERLARLQPDRAHRRNPNSDSIIELSSRTDSLKLPGLLDSLAVRLDENMGSCLDMLHTTSMFGTGVDVSRLSLMVVHGQPKTASAYIQATGRVGRDAPGLILTLHRAGRPRDLSHYEFFTGFHGGLYRYVEPITVSPFSPRALERAAGPIGVLLLRLAEGILGKVVPATFRRDPRTIHTERHHGSVKVIPQLLEDRAQGMPGPRRPNALEARNMTEGMLDTWERRSQDTGGLPLAYNEWTLKTPASKMVVLGDAAHRSVTPPALPGGVVRPSVSPACAFPNTPTSMREVEATTAFGERFETPPPQKRVQRGGVPPAGPVAAGRPR